MKKIFCLGLLILFVISLATPAAMANNLSTFESFDNEIVVTDEIITKISLGWAASTNPGLELHIDNIIPFHEVDGSKRGYVASYYSMRGEPFGYIILDFFSENIIEEYVIEKGALGIAETIAQNAQVDDYSKKINKNDAALYRTLPFQYVVSIKDDMEKNHDTRAIYGFDGEISQKEFSTLAEALEPRITRASTSTPTTAKVNHWGDVIIDSVPSIGYTLVQLAVLTPMSTPITEMSTISTVGRYACAVQALTNIANSKSMYSNNSFSDTYYLLWNASSTTFLPGQTVYGSTPRNRIGAALVTLGTSVGRTVTYSTSTSPTFNTFSSAVSASKPSVLTGTVTLQDNTLSAHTVFVTGFVVLSNGSATFNFIRIADGWGNNHRYINWANADLYERQSDIFTIG